MFQLTKQVATISITFYIAQKLTLYSQYFLCVVSFECSCRDDEVSRKTGGEGMNSGVRYLEPFTFFFFFFLSFTKCVTL